jgi:hypothetical protein
MKNPSPSTFFFVNYQLCQRLPLHDKTCLLSEASSAVLAIDILILPKLSCTIFLSKRVHKVWLSVHLANYSCRKVGNTKQ